MYLKSEPSSNSLILTINVSPNLLNILWRFSFVMINPKIISIGSMNDFPKLLNTIPTKLGFLPWMFVIFRLNIFFPIVWPVLYSKIIQYEKNITLVGIYIPSLVMKLSKSRSRNRKDRKNIDVDISEMITKSTTHAKNLSFHLASIIFDDSELSILLNNSYFFYLVKYLNYYKYLCSFLKINLGINSGNFNSTWITFW